MGCRVYCSLCHLTQPMDCLRTCTLPCSHVFCRLCFRDYCERKQVGSVIRVAAVPCPVCRRLVDVQLHCSSPGATQSPSTFQPTDTSNSSSATFHQQDSANDSGCHDEFDVFNEPATPAALVTSDVRNVAFVFPDIDRVSSSHKSQGEAFANGTVNIDIADAPYYKTDDQQAELLCRVASNDNSVPSGVLFSSNNTLVIVADYGKSLTELISAESALTLHQKTGLKPFSVGKHQDGLVIVGDRKSQTIVFVDENVETEVARWDSGMFRWISGVCGTREGNIAVFDRERYQVGIFTDSGQLVRQFGAYGTGKSQTCMANYLAVDAVGRIIISDSANHCLKLFDVQQGQQLLQVGLGRGAGDGYLEWPRGIGVDEYNNLIVADYGNRRVSLFDGRSGRFMKHLLNGIASPSALNYCTENRHMALTHYALTGYSQRDIYRLT